MDAVPAELLRSIRLVVFDFDGVFTDNTVYVFEDGQEAVRSWRGDGLGLRRLEEIGIAAVIISTEANPVVSVRARKLKIRYLQGVQDKHAALEEVARASGVALSQVAFVGNDVNDALCLAAVGLPIVVRDAHPEVVPMARYQTHNPGGRGAVREVCDLLYRSLHG